MSEALKQDEEKVYSFIERPDKAMHQHAGAEEVGEAEGDDQDLDDVGNADKDGRHQDVDDDSDADEDGAAGEQEEEDDTEDEDGDGLITLDGKTFTTEEVDEAIKSHQARSKWEATHTQKDQSLASQFKVIEGHSGLVRRLLGDKEAQGEIRDLLIDRLGEAAGNEFDALLKFDPEVLNEEHYDHQLGRTQKSLEESQAQQAAQAELLSLMEKHDLTHKQAKEVEAFADRTFDESGGATVLTLESAWRMMDVEKKEKDLARREKRLEKGLPPKTADKRRGTRAGQDDAPRKFKFIIDS